MRMFRVYAHPTFGHEAVKVGFSGPALFFGFLWLLAKRLWSHAGVLLPASLALMLVQTVTDAAGSEPVAQVLVYLLLIGGSFAIVLVPGLKVNDWWASNLVSRGYQLLAEVPAETPDAAIAQAVRSSQAAASPLAGPAPPVAPHPLVYDQRHFVCDRCHDRISDADAAWDRLVRDRRCPRCGEPATLS